MFVVLLEGARRPVSQRSKSAVGSMSCSGIIAWCEILYPNLNPHSHDRQLLLFLIDKVNEKGKGQGRGRQAQRLVCPVGSVVTFVFIIRECERICFVTSTVHLAISNRSVSFHLLYKHQG